MNEWWLKEMQDILAQEKRSFAHTERNNNPAAYK